MFLNPSFASAVRGRTELGSEEAVQLAPFVQGPIHAEGSNSKTPGLLDGSLELVNLLRHDRETVTSSSIATVREKERDGAFV